VARRSLASAALALLAACAHVTTSERDATIWFDGRPVGRSGWVWALGPPHTARVLVVGRDGRRAHALVEREFTSRTLVGGFYTMGVCFLFCWRYPDVVVPLPPPRSRVATWDDEGWDAAWLAPPGATGTTTTATPTATANTIPLPAEGGSTRFGAKRH
jgi:hypothetical protein